MKPLIGISVGGKAEPENARTGGRLILNWNYADAIATAGGIPILIPPQADVAELAPLLDGILIPGGPDIDPAEYGEKPHKKVTELVERDRYELESRLFSARRKNQPYLGICYGCQFLNVQRGGSLEQHVVDRVQHEEDIHGAVQVYGVQPGSKLEAIVGGNAQGQSWHHQAVWRVGAGLEVVARNEDGTVEALEDPAEPFVIGVQWHPERTLATESSRALFESFIAAAREFKQSK